MKPLPIKLTIFTLFLTLNSIALADWSQTQKREFEVQCRSTLSMFHQIKDHDFEELGNLYCRCLTKVSSQEFPHNNIDHKSLVEIIIPAICLEDIYEIFHQQ